MSTASTDDDYDDVPEFENGPDDDGCEPIGSCEECEQDIFADDYFVIGGDRLCSQCAWLAMGCPEPGNTADSDDDLDLDGDDEE